MVEVGRRGDHVLAVVDPDVGQGRERIDQRVTGEDGVGAQLGEDRLGPTAREEVAVLVGVAATLGADVEVDLLTGLARRLADVAGTARSGLFRGSDDILSLGTRRLRRLGEDFWINGSVALNVPPKVVPAGRSFGWPVLMSMRVGADRVVEEQLSEVALRLGRLIAIATRHRDFSVRCGNLQLVQASNLLTDEPSKPTWVNPTASSLVLSRSQNKKTDHDCAESGRQTFVHNRHTFALPISVEHNVRRAARRLPQDSPRPNDLNQPSEGSDPSKRG